MTITIEDLQTPTETHQLYTVTIFNTPVTTTLTHTPSIVDDWISETLRLHPTNLTTVSTNPIVGLDVEWRPSFNRSVENPVSILQLCIGTRCLIFQLIYSPRIPQSLIDFLRNPNFSFAGVGIQEDVEKLLVDHEIGVTCMLDVRPLAAEKLGVKELKNAGLKDLAKEVLGYEIVKPKRVTMSRWDCEWLTYDQIQYACADAYLSAEIGKNLIAREAQVERNRFTVVL